MIIFQLNHLLEELRQNCLFLLRQCRVEDRLCIGWIDLQITNPNYRQFLFSVLSLNGCVNETGATWKGQTPLSRIGLVSLKKFSKPVKLVCN